MLVRVPVLVPFHCEYDVEYVEYDDRARRRETGEPLAVAKKNRTRKNHSTKLPNRLGSLHPYWWKRVLTMLTKACVRRRHRRRCCRARRQGRLCSVAAVAVKDVEANFRELPRKAIA